MKHTDKEGYQITRKLRTTEGEMAFHLDVFGDHLAKREGYHDHKGVDALRYFLMQKHHWLPSQVRSLSWDDLRFALEEEMAGWTLPKDAR